MSFKSVLTGTTLLGLALTASSVSWAQENREACGAGQIFLADMCLDLVNDQIADMPTEFIIERLWEVEDDLEYEREDQQWALEELEGEEQAEELGWLNYTVRRLEIERLFLRATLVERGELASIEGELDEPPAPPAPPPPPPAPAPAPPPPPPPPPQYVEPRPIAQLQDFPWPPPKPSDRMALSRSLLLNPGEELSVLAVSERFTEALNTVGYSDHRFYSAPGDGFALITRMERIRPDGTPEAEQLRFLPPDADEPFSLGRFMSELFFAPEGYYRVVVFVASKEIVTTSNERMTEDQAELLMSESLTRLPRYPYGELAFSDEYYVDALVYEFYKGPADRDVVTVPPVRLSANAHLEKIAITEALRKQRSDSR